MRPTDIAAVARIAADVMGIVSRKLDASKSASQLKLGPIHLPRKKKSKDLTMWIGVAAIATGAFLLLAERKR